LVVTNSDRPSGLKLTCPGVPVKGVAAVVPRPRLRDDPGIGETRPPKMRYPDRVPPPSAFRTYAWFPCTVTLTGNSPPDQMTWVSLSWSPETLKTETLLLPGLTAKSRPLARS
jgi:hypothetical protein